LIGHTGIVKPGRRRGALRLILLVSAVPLLSSGVVACESPRSDAAVRTASADPSSTAPTGTAPESSTSVPAPSTTAAVSWPVATDAVAQMGDGVNFGSALEAPNEGEWGPPITDATISAVVSKGFHTVRLPVRWSGHAADVAPFTIDPSFFRRVDTVVDALLAKGVVVVLDVHHYDAVMDDPGGQAERFLGLWQQISSHYTGRSPNLWFELLNEPNSNVTGDVWNVLARDALVRVRETNPTRIVVIGPVNLDDADHLAALDLPADPYLMSTIHYYGPIEFTHAGVSWIPGSAKWIGRRWRGTDADRAALREVMAQAARFRQDTGIPVFLGEFGVPGRPAPGDIGSWLQAMVCTASSMGIPWIHWIYGGYDPTIQAWDPVTLAGLRSVHDQGCPG